MPKKVKKNSFSSKKKKLVSLSTELSSVFQRAYQAHQAGRLDEARVLYSSILSKQASHAETNFLSGLLAFSLSQHAQAEILMAKAVELAPNQVRYLVGLSSMHLHVGHYQAAATLLEKAVKLAPRDIEPWYNLGNAYLKLGRYLNAADCLEKVLKLKPGHLGATNNLGLVYLGLCRIDQSTKFYQRALDIDPTNLKLASNVVFNANYRDDLTPDEVYGLHAKLGQMFPRAKRARKHLLKEHERLRIGYVSADFREHSVAYFLWPLIKHHDETRFDITCFYNNHQTDDVTKKFRERADHWVSIADMTDEAFADAVLTREIDILIDLSGHSGENRLAAFATRIAPVQLTWLGYPHSTSLSEIDYRIVDQITDPAGRSEAFNSEQLIRLPDSFLSYRGNSDVLCGEVLPAQSKGYITFGSFNNLAKVNRRVIKEWTNILKAVPGSKLVLKAKQLSEPTVLERYRGYFLENGIADDRLDFRAYTANKESHLLQYNEIDIALDSFPYNGTTTTCEALWMGVPTICMLGDRHAARVSASIMTHAGLEGFIAKDLDDYVTLAKTWATKISELAILREGMRERILNSKLCDAKGFSTAMESAFLMTIEEIS